MAQVIQLKDGSLHTVLGEQDILSLVEEKLGMEVRQVLEEFLFEHSEDAEYIADLEKEAEEKLVEEVIDYERLQLLISKGFEYDLVLSVVNKFKES